MPGTTNLPAQAAVSAAQPCRKADMVEVTAKMEADAKRKSVLHAMPWEHVKQLIDMQTGERMRRSYPVQIAYEQHKVWAKQQYGSGAEYLVQTALAEFINKTKADGFDAKSPLESSDFMFRANDFPYYFGDGAEHWVMWCTKRLEPGFEAPVVAVKAIEQRFGQDVEWRYLVNSVEHQSVREISHAHIFIKRV